MRRWCAPSIERLLAALLLAAALPQQGVAQDLAPPAAASAPSAPLDLNSASRASLESLDGLGPALADRLLKARQQGHFRDWSDLLRRVSGLGPRLAQRLSAQGLRIADEAYLPAAP